MEWSPISENAMWDLLLTAESQMDIEVSRFWEAVRVTPEKWKQHPYGDQGGGFWVVGVIGSRVIWFNDIEDGFNVSSYSNFGEIGEYWCNQDELEHVLLQLLYCVQTGVPITGRASPPI